MRKLLRWSPILLLFVPSWAYALTLEYLTYNAFDETVAAFKRLALIASDSGFMILAACFVAVTCIGGALLYAQQGLGGRGGGNPMALVMAFLFGILLFWGMVLPKGALQIYDPVRNKTQLIPNIPAVIVLLAGGLSAVEKGMTTMVDTASATPYKDDVGGISYALINAATRASAKQTGLERSIAQYFKDCGMTAIGSNYNGATMDEVMHGAPGFELYNAFAKYNHPAWPTVWFPDGNDGGQTGSCAESWNYLSGKLNGSLPSTVAPMRRELCQANGFNMADPSDVSACDAALATAADMWAGTTANALLRTIAMARGIQAAMNDPDFNVGISALVNRQMMAEAFGASEAMNQWIPRLRGLMIAVAVGIAPICLLFVATPLSMRALSVMAGMFIWLALWGICDVIAIQMQKDAAFDAFQHVAQNNLGYRAVMEAPQGALAALGVFGKARTMAMILATVLAGGLFKLQSSYAFTTMGQHWQGDFNQAGESAGKRRLQVEEQAAMQEQLNSAPGTMGRVAQFGYDRTMGAANFGQQQSVAQYDYVAGVTGGQTSGLAYEAGTISGGKLMGDVAGHREIAGGLNAPLGAAAAGVAAANTARSGGNAMGARERAGEDLYGVGRIEGMSSVTGTEARRELASEFGGHSDGDNLKSLATQEIGSTAGMASQSGYRPAEARRYYDSQFERGFAELAAFSEIGMTPGRVGHAGGIESATDARATERTMRDFGPGAMTAGKELSKDEAAVRGTTAGELGGVATVAGVTARNQVAADFGRSSAQQQMAGFLFGDSTADLSRFHEAGGRVYHGSLDGDAARRVADWTQQQGLISPAEASALRSKADSGFSAAVAFGENGQIASFNLDGRYGGMVGDTFSDVSGMTYQRGDAFQVGDRTEVAQGMSLRGESAVDTLEEFVRKTEGSSNLSEEDRLALAGGYAQRAGSEGFSGQARRDDSRITATTAGVGADGRHGGGGAKAGGGAIGKVMSVVGANVGVSGTNQDIGGWSTSQDYVLTSFDQSLNDNYRQARDPVYERYGSPDAWDADTRQQAQREIAERWNVINEGQYATLKGKMSDDTANQAARGQGESEWEDFKNSDNKLERLGAKASEVYEAARDKFLPW